ncbi:hypothetical protein GP5015_387 [gamma proteobacterium HTCC5015]|nr:hypothetical protein GP5015_387 [gamma proteobacterium HTCC5015]
MGVLKRVIAGGRIFFLPRIRGLMSQNHNQRLVGCGFF